MASTYLSKTFGSAGDQQIMTISFWMKRSALGGTNEVISQGSGSACHINLQSSGTMEMNLRNSVDGASNVFLITSRLFRDTSAWYHVVLSLDTTQATASNRAKLYINGVQETSFGTENYPSQNGNLFFNEASAMQIGQAVGGSSNFDGSLTHFHFIDGTAYAASTFGETDSLTGIWKAKTAPSVTYGTNGFFLKFENSGSMGTDSSGNANNFTVSGNLTQTVDTPSNVFATMNPLVGQSGYSFSQGNNTLTWSTNNKSSSSTLGITSGKYYWEAKYITSASNNVLIGVGNESINHNDWVGIDGSSWGYYGANGEKYNGSGGVAYGNTFTTNDIISIALDMDNNAIYFAKNGVWQNSGDPTSGASQTGAAFTNLNGTIFPAISGYSGDVVSFNFGNGYFGTTAVASANADDNGIGAFEYAPPTGYLALCTKNINAQEYS